MKNYAIRLPKLNSQEDFNHFISETGGQYINDTLLLNGAVGNGVVKIFHHDAGFYLSAWNVTFNDPIDIYKEALPVYFTNNSYSILFILTPGSVLIRKIGAHQQYAGLESRSNLFLPDDVSINFQLKPGLPVQLLYFNITTFWLRQHFKDTDLSLFDLGNADDWETSMIKIDLCCMEMANEAQQLLVQCLAQNANAHNLQQASTQLVTQCITRKFNQDISNVDVKMKHNYYEQMLEVEQILQNYLQNNLPTLETIAKSVGLSVSTLKRKFKAVFGKSIYEYYLEKKMNLAKSLLTQKPLSVNEAAEIFGYEKVSNFIDIFKKHHGFSPGKFKKVILAG